MHLFKLGPLDHARLADVEQSEHHHLTFILGQADRPTVQRVQRKFGAGSPILKKPFAWAAAASSPTARIVKKIRLMVLIESPSVFCHRILTREKITGNDIRSARASANNPCRS